MWLDVSGEKRQRGNTKTMIFGLRVRLKAKGPYTRRPLGAPG
jgi:hypothetical protein